MLAVRLFRRIPVTNTTIKRASCLRLFAGIASGGGALTLAWKHYRVQASAPPKQDIHKMQPVIAEVATQQPSSEKFDWKLFWYYLRPQIWVIACATAVSLVMHYSIDKMKFLHLDSTCSCLFKCRHSIGIRKPYKCSINFTQIFIIVHRL